MKEMKNGVFTYNDQEYNFDFRTSLPAYEKQMFVQTVVNNLVDDTSYDVVLRDLVFDFVIVEMFTNVDTSFINIKDENGEDVNPIIPIEHFLEESDIMNVIKANIEDGLLDELNHAIDLNIQYRTGIKPNPLSESISHLISTLEKKIEEVDLEGMMGMAQKFAGMTEDFNLENLVNAYMNSDTHKKNETEIKEIGKSKKSKK